MLVSRRLKELEKGVICQPFWARCPEKFGPREGGMENLVLKLEKEEVSLKMQLKKKKVMGDI